MDRSDWRRDWRRRLPQVEADVLPDLTALVGTMHSQGTRPLNPTNNAMFPIEPADSLIENPNELGRSYIDDMAIGTAWQDVATVERATDNPADQSHERQLHVDQQRRNGVSIERVFRRVRGRLTERHRLEFARRAECRQLDAELRHRQSVRGDVSGGLHDSSCWRSIGTWQSCSPWAEQRTRLGDSTTSDNLLNLLNVEFVSVIGVAGDYNGDGTVDTADYVLWRNGGPLQNEGMTPGSVTPEDYTFWRSRFGMTIGSGTGRSVAVPEPATCAIAFLLVVACCCCPSTSAGRRGR